ncbi:MAG: AAA family ATPase [Desulfovibrionaceae bacterium]|nr:AAA family ATPase [Desulfovibrionaceae bacterium]
MINIPAGISNFREIREENYYYIDKTFFLEEFFIAKPVKVSLITRPRRFGKTLTLSMLEEFFDITKESGSLFSGLSIAKNKELCSEWMNKYPIISISFKSIASSTFQLCMESLAELIAELCEKHEYLLESERVTPRTRKILQSFYDNNASKISIRNSLKIFTKALANHWKKPAIVLIDEYDVPINTAWKNDFYIQMIDCMRSLLGEVLKDNEFLKFAIITGCLRISKESIFTGVNNFSCYTISNDFFSNVFGFTEKDVDNLLEIANFSETDININIIKEEIKKWYDGYLFGENTEIFCPWDILLYLRDLLKNPKRKPQSYWINTSENAIIRRLVEIDVYNTRKALEVLINGGILRVAIQESMSFDALKNDPSLVWSILYASGYLTKSTKGQKITNTHFILDYSGKVMRKGVDLVIPNREIREIFLDTIDTWFSSKLLKKTEIFNKLLDAFLQGNSKIATEELQKILIKTISYYDTQEYFYHAFLAGLLSGIEGLEIQSNREHGHGRTDITMYDRSKNKIVIFEIKHLKFFSKATNSIKEPQLIEHLSVDNNCLIEDSIFFTKEQYLNKIKKFLRLLAKKALEQIKKKEYASEYITENIPENIVIWGISFFKKECLAIAEILK